MNILFYISAILAIVATLRMITGKNAVHSLLYLIVSLLAVSVIFFLLGAPFIAALEVIIYAGAIMVLLQPGIWTGPSLITAVLFLEMAYMLVQQPASPVEQAAIAAARQEIPPGAVGALLFTKYILVVELAAFLLVAGIIGAYHLGQKEKISHHRFLKNQEKSI